MPKGKLTPEHLARHLGHGHNLVCVSQACNETGRTVPIAALADCCAKHQAKLFVDAVQVPGRLPLPNFHPALTAMTISAHKFGGPRGAGALIHHDFAMESILVGGSQENHLRPGTENLPGILSMIAAMEIVLSKPQTLRSHAKYLWETITDIPGILLNSDLEEGLPGLVSVSIPGIQGSEIVADLSLQGFFISAGSACSAGAREPSRQMLLLGRSVSEALGSLRLSLGTEHTKTDLDALAQAFKTSVRRQR
jgi:cysteine desulfurase